MDTKGRILEAALAVFARYGYRQTPMEAVAEQAELSRQALYRHFPTKEALFAAGVESLHAAALAAADEAVRAARRAGEDAAGVLVAQLAAHYAAVTGGLHESPHAAELIDEKHRQCGAIAAEWNRRFAARLVATIRGESRAGRLTLARGLSADALAELLATAARGVKATSPPPSPAAFRRELARIVRLLVAGAARAE